MTVDRPLFYALNVSVDFSHGILFESFSIESFTTGVSIHLIQPNDRMLQMLSNPTLDHHCLLLFICNFQLFLPILPLPLCFYICIYNRVQWQVLKTLLMPLGAGTSHFFNILLLYYHLYLLLFNGVYS